MINRFFFLATLLLLLGGNARAQQQTEAGAARLALTDILVQEVKNGRQASFSLRWDYLPLSESLKNRYVRVFTFDGKLASAEDIALPNKLLRLNPEEKEAWFKGLKEKRWMLASALSRGRFKAPANAREAQNSPTLKEVLKAGEDAWNQAPEEALGLNLDGRITVRTLDYLAAKRDFYAMLYLLKDSNGAGAVLDFEPQPRGANPTMLADGLTWHIRVFPLETTTKDPIYRFAVSVQTPTIKKLFRGTEDAPATEKPKVHATVGLLKEDKISDLDGRLRTIYRMAKVSLAEDGTTVDASPLPGASKLEAPDASKLSPSSGETALDIFAGGSLKGLLAPLIANDSEAQLFSGGLIGRGEPKALLGLNYIFTEQPDGNLGFLYGFVPNADASDGSLFLGPSLQFGPFILGVGALIFARHDESVAATLGATLSVDLSRAFGRSPKPIQLSPKLLKDDSQIWQDSEVLYGSLNLLFFRVQVSGAGSSAPIRVQETDAMGNPKADGFAASLTGTDALKMKVIPKAPLRFTAPQGYKILVHRPTNNQPLTAAQLASLDPALFEDFVNLSAAGNQALSVIVVLRKN